MKTVAILFGGKSSEYEVSLVSATGAYTNIDKNKYNVVLIGITREGRFFVYEDDPGLIACDKWTEGKKIPLALDLAEGKLYTESDGICEYLAVDVILPMIHGKFCEDGTIQGMFAVAGIPVVGCDCQSSAVCMDKDVTKTIVGEKVGVRMAKSAVLKKAERNSDALSECGKLLGYPMFVKPCRAGSSVGVTKVKTPESLASAVEAAFREDTKVLVEAAVAGKEIEVAVLEEQGRYTVAHPAEIDNGGAEFYDYDTKYITNTSTFYIPARIPAHAQEKVRELAEAIFRALDCSGFARVDFFYTPEGELVFNEINTLPGFTPISMYPKMMINEGISYSDLLDRLIQTVL